MFDSTFLVREWFQANQPQAEIQGIRTLPRSGVLLIRCRVPGCEGSVRFSAVFDAQGNLTGCEPITRSAGKRLGRAGTYPRPKKDKAQRRRKQAAGHDLGPWPSVSAVVNTINQNETDKEAQ